MSDPAARARASEEDTLREARAKAMIAALHRPADLPILDDLAARLGLSADPEHRP